MTYLAVAEAVVTTQRDFGDRTNRKHARLKYTIEDRGLDWFREQVEERSGVVTRRADRNLMRSPRTATFTAGNATTLGKLALHVVHPERPRRRLWRASPA